MFIQFSVFMLVATLNSVYSKTLSDASRIVGGQESEVNVWPWQVSLQYNNNHICGGTLIDTDVVLTAAHCVDFGSASDFSVVLGEHELNVNSGREQRLNVQRITMHNNYGASLSGYPNDIAILKLSSAAQLNSYVQLAPMADAGEEFVGNSECYLTGWGKTSGSSNSVSPILMEVNIDVITNSDCRRQYRRVSGASILSTHICLFKTGKGSCNGDSGGPLVCRVGNQFKLAGVTSWGMSTCEGYPSVYTRVSQYRSWISSNM